MVSEFGGDVGSSSRLDDPMSTTFTFSSADGSAVSIDSSSDDALDVLGFLSSTQEQVGRWRREAVVQARSQGRSWAEIGAALGMSRQAAWEQFSSDVDAMLEEIHERSGLGEDEAMKLANDEIRAMRSEGRQRADRQFADRRGPERVRKRRHRTRRTGRSCPTSRSG